MTEDGGLADGDVQIAGLDLDNGGEQLVDKNGSRSHDQSPEVTFGKRFWTAARDRRFGIFFLVLSTLKTKNTKAANPLPHSKTASIFRDRTENPIRPVILTGATSFAFIIPLTKTQSIVARENG
jgi:hypothetical protein